MIWGLTMPLYAYHCERCGAESEFLQSVQDEPMRDCPSCGESGLKKQVTAPSFSFKGSGWYKDLYSSSGGKSDAKSDAKTETKTESTPAKKSDTKSTATAAK